MKAICWNGTKDVRVETANDLHIPHSLRAAPDLIGLRCALREPPKEKESFMTDGCQRQNVSLPVKLAFAGAAAAVMGYAMRQRRRMDFEGKTVAIAGASRGLGLELARGFAKEGAHVVLLARNRVETR